MKVIAIDASTKSTGVAFFDEQQLIDFICITAGSSDLIKRIQKIVKELNEFLNKYPADKIILEEVLPDGTVATASVSTHRALMWA